MSPITRPACPHWCDTCEDGGDAAIHNTKTVTVVDHDNGTLITARVWVEQFQSYANPDKSSQSPRVNVEILNNLSIDGWRDVNAAAEQLMAEATQ